MTQNVLDSEHAVKVERGTVLQDPPIAQFLFSDTRVSLVWLAVRVLLGFGWLSAGFGKLIDPDWITTGVALKGFWTAAVKIPTDGSKPLITFDWYRSFIQSMLDAGSYVWFAKLIAIGETLVGVALILGLFVGIFAFIGAFLNWNYIMAGSASSNGLFGLAAVLLILAWKTAGYYGFDRWLLPLLGTTWQKVSGAQVYRATKPAPSQLRE